MNRSIIISALLTVLLSLSACDQKPTVVNVPAGPPGPAGPKGAPGVEGASGVEGAQGNQGETGTQGDTGNKGETGKTGDSTTVIITPPVEPPSAN